MPLPLIPIVVVAVVAGATAVTTAVLNQTLSRKLKDKRVAILGARQTGKTSLLRFLQLDGLLEGDVSSTVNTSSGGTFDLQVQGATVRFDVLKDVPGSQGLAFKDWRAAVEGADYVWYLFRADRVTDGNATEIELIRKHLTSLTTWIDSTRGDKPKVILVGTHADGNPKFWEAASSVVHAAISADVINFYATKLDASVVVGSLATDESAKRLRRALTGQL
ncbi:GTPase domain-containing protein [Microbacterium keratanolyticum]